VSLDGTRLYAATTAGILYALDTTNNGSTVWALNARSEIGLANNNASFLGSGPWVSYTDGSIYIAANYLVSNTARIRLYKLSAAGAVLAKLDIGSAAAPRGIASSLIAWDAIYFGTTTGHIYKVNDNGTSFSVVSGWPIALWSAHGGANNSVVQRFGQPIYGTPTIDVEHNLLFIQVNNVFFSVNMASAAIQWVEGGWTNGTEATANDVPTYSSPWVDLDLMTAFIGHGKNQGSGNSGPRCHRRIYGADGVFDTSALTSVATVGTSSDLTHPRSSPLVLHQSDGTVHVFIGDPQGNLNRWSYSDTFGTRAHFDSGQSGNPAIQSPIIIDYLAGNIYFGDDSGRIYQITQNTLR
jgi:hypothetical protein